VFDKEKQMKVIIGLCMAAGVATLIGGCADRDYAVGIGVGPVALADCDGFYDDFYGPFDDGCWADDGVFWYRGRDHQYHRDIGGHFSHAGAAGTHPVHGAGPGSGAHFGGGHGHT
jgi:hypothetical protein